MCSIVFHTHSVHILAYISYLFMALYQAAMWVIETINTVSYRSLQLNISNCSKWTIHIFKCKMISMSLESKNGDIDVGDQMCWWQVWDVGDRFRMLVTDLFHWENHQHNEKSHHHKITNITMSPTSLSPC